MDIFSIFCSIRVCCVFSLESPHRGDSNEYTQYIIFKIKEKITLNYPKSVAMSFCFKGLKNEFETAVVNESSVVEPLKFYCICCNRSVSFVQEEEEVEKQTTKREHFELKKELLLTLSFC